MLFLAILATVPTSVEAGEALTGRASLVLDGWPKIDAVESAGGAEAIGILASRPAVPALSWQLHAAQVTATVIEPAGVRVESPLGPAGIGTTAHRRTETLRDATLVRLGCLASCLVFVKAEGDGSRWALEGTALSPLGIGTRRLDARPGAHAQWPEAASVVVEAPHVLLKGSGATLRGEGRWTLILWNATATIESREGERSYTAEAAPTSHGALPYREESWSVVILEAEDARFVGDDPRPSLLVAAPAVRLAFSDGGVAAPAAWGTVIAGGVVREARGDAIRLSGAFDATLEPFFSSGDLRNADVRLEAKGAYDARIGEAAPIHEALGGAARLSLGALFAIALAEAAARVVSGHGLMGFFTRLRRDRLLSNPVRAAILEALAGTPGLTVSELRRRLGKGLGVLGAHLARLERAGFLRSERHGRYRAYFPAGAVQDAGERAALAALANATRLRVARAVCGDAPRTQRDVAEACGLSRRLVSYHLGCLKSVSLVDETSTRPRAYVPTPALRAALARSPAPTPDPREGPGPAG